MDSLSKSQVLLIRKALALYRLQEARRAARHHAASLRHEAESAMAQQRANEAATILDGLMYHYYDDGRIHGES